MSLPDNLRLVIYFHEDCTFKEMARFIQPFFVKSPELEDAKNVNPQCVWLMPAAERDTLLQTRLPAQLKEFINFFRVFFVDLTHGNLLDWDDEIDADHYEDALDDQRPKRAAAAARAAVLARSSRLAVLSAILQSFEPTFLAIRSPHGEVPERNWLTHLARAAEKVTKMTATSADVAAAPKLAFYAPGLFILLDFQSHMKLFNNLLCPIEVGDAYYYGLIEAYRNRTAPLGGGGVGNDADKLLLSVDNEQVLQQMQELIDKIGVVEKKKKVELKFRF